MKGNKTGEREREKKKGTRSSRLYRHSWVVRINDSVPSSEPIAFAYSSHPLHLILWHQPSTKFIIFHLFLLSHYFFRVSWCPLLVWKMNEERCAAAFKKIPCKMICYCVVGVFLCEEATTERPWKWKTAWRVLFSSRMKTPHVNLLQRATTN